jgi:hypothetical protein
MQIKLLSRPASIEGPPCRPFSPMRRCDFVNTGDEVKPEGLQERSSDLMTLNVEPIDC